MHHLITAATIAAVLGPLHVAAVSLQHPRALSNQFDDLFRRDMTDDQIRIVNRCSESVSIAGNLKEVFVSLSPSQEAIVTPLERELAFLLISDSGRVDPRLDTTTCGINAHTRSYSINCERSSRTEVAIVNGNDCLEAKDNSIRLSTCRGDEEGDLVDEQIWSVVSGGSTPGAYTFASRSSTGNNGKCIAVNGQQATLISCDDVRGGFAIPSSSAPGAITVLGQNLCLDSEMRFRTCNGDDSQQFSLPDPSDVEPDENAANDDLPDLTDGDKQNFLDGISSKADDIISSDDLFDEIDDRIGDLMETKNADSAVFSQLKIKAIDILVKKIKDKVGGLADSMGGYDQKVLEEYQTQSYHAMDFSILSYLLAHPTETFFKCDTIDQDDNKKHDIDCPKVVKVDGNCDDSGEDSDGCAKKYDAGEGGKDPNYMDTKRVDFKFVNGWTEEKIKAKVEKDLGITKDTWGFNVIAPVRFIYFVEDVPGGEPLTPGHHSHMYYARQYWYNAPYYAGFDGLIDKRTRDKVKVFDEDMKEPLAASKITDFDADDAPDNMDEWDELVEAAMMVLVNGAEAVSDANGVIDSLDSIKKRFDDEKNLIIGMILLPLELAIPVVGEAIAGAMAAVTAVNSIRTVAAISSIVGRIASFSFTELIGLAEVAEFLNVAREMATTIRRTAKTMSKLFRSTMKVLKKGPKAIAKKLRKKLKSARKGHGRNKERRKQCRKNRSSPESGSRKKFRKEEMDFDLQNVFDALGRRSVINETIPDISIYNNTMALEKRAGGSNLCPFKVKKASDIKKSSDQYNAVCLRSGDFSLEDVHMAVGMHLGFQNRRTFRDMKNEQDRLKAQGLLTPPGRKNPKHIGECDHAVEAQEWKRFIDPYIKGATSDQIDALCNSFPSDAWITTFNTDNMIGISVGINQMKQILIKKIDANLGSTNTYCNFETTRSTAKYMIWEKALRRTVATKLSGIVASWVAMNKGSPALAPFPRLQNYQNDFGAVVDQTTDGVIAKLLAARVALCRDRCVKDMLTPWRIGGNRNPSAADIKKWCPDGEKERKSSSKGCRSAADGIADAAM
ncbi:hypothetical protein HDU97_007099 [Phlyctochytrium planicorne]|nr:hypothetical protein HDU97_007099 [Phlyctochytrium planicorne]